MMVNRTSFETVANGDILSEGYFNGIKDNSDTYSEFTRLIEGCDLTEQGTPDLTAELSAGVVQIDGSFYDVSANTATFTNADGSNPRWDIVSINTSGVIVVTAGTAASSPVMPAIPSNECVVAAVYRGTSDNTINSIHIVKYWNDSRKNTGERLIYEYNSGDDETAGYLSVNLPMPEGASYKTFRIVITKYLMASGTESLQLQFNNVVAANYYSRVIDGGTNQFVLTGPHSRFYLILGSDVCYGAGDFLVQVNNTYLSGRCTIGGNISGSAAVNTVDPMIDGRYNGSIGAGISGMKLYTSSTNTILGFKIYAVDDW